MATLFWALWDEAWTQRPWKAFQEHWKDRYTAFLNTARSKSATSEMMSRRIRITPPSSKPTKRPIRIRNRKPRKRARKLDEASARLLAVQSVFTDRRAYVNALTYEIETSTSASSKASKRKEIERTRGNRQPLNSPTAVEKKYTFPQLEETYNEIRDERTKLSLELGDVLKPVTAAKAKMDEYISDHMVDLTPQQIDGLEETGDRMGSGDRADQCGRGQYRRPLRILPHERPRAAENHCGVDDGEGREEARRIRRCLRKPSRARVIEDSRSGKVRLLALPSGQRPRHHQHREGARKLRALAVAAISQGKRASRLPELPRCRHGAGQRRRAVANHQQRQRPLPPARLHGLPSL